jgi:hypothetical protein
MLSVYSIVFDPSYSGEEDAHIIRSFTRREYAITYLAEWMKEQPADEGWLMQADDGSVATGCKNFSPMMASVQRSDLYGS